MADLHLLPESESQNLLANWITRGGVALFFFIFGMEKFSADAGSHWVHLFHEIGAGDWFRYFAGVVELLGGALVLVPRTTAIGFALLGSTMAAAVLILIFVVGRPADGIFPGLILAALVAIGWKLRHRRC